jgi:ribosomal protein S18 acetylase RimI-like enzyme
MVVPIDGSDMNVRTARPADRPAIRDIARRSLHSSYSLDPKAIMFAVDEWYEEDTLTDLLAEEMHLLLVAEEDGQVIAFSEGECTPSGEGRIMWLHVDPAHRGRHVGFDLYDETERHLREMGATHLHARVLDDNEVGNEFYREHDFEKVGEQTVEIGEETYIENIYVESDYAEMESIVLDDGTTVYLSHEETDTGSLDVFLTVYGDPEGEEKYGYYCANCGSLANAMDAMGRIECNACGNVRKPTRWDAAYL